MLQLSVRQHGPKVVYTMSVEVSAEAIALPGLKAQGATLLLLSDRDAFERRRSAEWQGSVEQEPH